MAPRVVATSDAIDISNRIPRGVERQLGAMGYEVRRSPLSHAFVGVHGITAMGRRAGGRRGPAVRRHGGGGDGTAGGVKRGGGQAAAFASRRRACRMNSV